MNAVDTNVLVYSIDAFDTGKRQRALELIESLPEAETIIPWQVACEVASVIRSMATSGKFQGDYAEAITSLEGAFRLHYLNFLLWSVRCESR